MLPCFHTIHVTQASMPAATFACEVNAHSSQEKLPWIANWGTYARTYILNTVFLVGFLNISSCMSCLSHQTSSCSCSASHHPHAYYCHHSCTHIMLLVILRYIILSEEITGTNKQLLLLSKFWPGFL